MDVKECKICKATKEFALFYRHKEKLDGYQNECKECIKIRSSKWRKANPSWVRQQAREQRAKHNYGVTIEVYESRINAVNGCEICGIKEKLVYDHIHNENKDFRGILCKKCNLGIGFLNDNTRLMENAIDYLNKPLGESIENTYKKEDRPNKRFRLQPFYQTNIVGINDKEELVEIAHSQAQLKERGYNQSLVSEVLNAHRYYHKKLYWIYWQDFISGTYLNYKQRKRSERNKHK